MGRYVHILVATDFSEQSASAAARAAELASEEGSAVSVLHVVDYIPPPYVTEQLPAEFSSPAKLIAAARANLSKWVAARGITAANEWVEAGSPKSEIARMARENHVDLIVMGPHGTGALHRLLGSAAVAVLHDAPCDVLVVHAPKPG